MFLMLDLQKRKKMIKFLNRLYNFTMKIYSNNNKNISNNNKNKTKFINIIIIINKKLNKLTF